MGDSENMYLENLVKISAIEDMNMECKASLDGTQIQIDMFRNRLEISSPRSFYQGEKIGKTYDLSKIISKRRNELICGMLVKCNGCGRDRI